MEIVINIELKDLMIVIFICSFFFKQIKKKGDEVKKLPKLDVIFKTTLVIGKNNNVNNNVNIKK